MEQASVDVSGLALGSLFCWGPAARSCRLPVTHYPAKMVDLFSQDQPFVVRPWCFLLHPWLLPEKKISRAI